jgi:glyoxylase-like metal-dependent hydrolase (beta-lactamase superfamily II)
MTYGYEVDFLPVEAAGGGGTKSGDAIAGRVWLPDGSCRVFVVDGGHSAIGEDLIGHIDTYYRTDTVDIVVSTHADSDHLNGLLRVVEEMRVGELLVHQPRNHLAPADVAYFTNIEMVDAVIDAAESRGVTVAEPFTGLTRWGGQFGVPGPHRGVF